MKNEALSDGKKTLTFQETELISTYLFDFVAGDFKTVRKVVDGREMTMLHRETDSVKVARNIDEIFKLHRSSID